MARPTHRRGGGGGGGWRWPGHIARAFGIGALVAGGLTVALWLLAAVVLIAPLVFWLAWNALELGPALGLPELGFWATVLATMFVTFGWFGKVTITAVVFLIDPTWLHHSATVRWPEPTLRNFVAIALLAALAAGPQRRHHSSAPARRAPDARHRLTAEE